MLRLKDGSFIERLDDGVARKVRLCHGCQKYRDYFSFYVDQRGRPLKLCGKCRRRKRSDGYQKWRDHILYTDELHDFIAKLCSPLTQRKPAKLGFDLNASFLMDLYFEQNGMCAISGVPMTYMPRTISRRTWTNISVDRIDSDKGYLQANVQLVTIAINLMKQNMTLDELRFWCAQVVLFNSENDEDCDQD